MSEGAAEGSTGSSFAAARRPAALVGPWFRDLRRLLPVAADYRGLRGTWRGDVLAGVTVAIVALPLALAFGITSGMGAPAGIMTAIVAGAIAAVFGGSNVQVSGPTGAMAAVLVPIVHRLGPEAVIVVGVMAGVLLLIGAVMRIGRYVTFVPWPVIEGFTVGIAVIIGLQQLPALLGVPQPSGDNSLVVAGQAIASAVGGLDPATVLVSAVAIATMLVVPRISRAIPASLVTVVVATLVAEVVAPGVARIGALPGTLPSPTIPLITPEMVSTLFAPALAVALLAALESLLSARVADGMVDTARHDPDRELLGQGLANLVAPLFGGMPATGAIARTAVNVRAGARTRVAALTHSGVLVVIVLFAGGLVGRIPLASLAGVLVVTAVRMVDPENVRAVLRSTGPDAAVLCVTAALTVAFDLILAVEVGIAVAAVLALRSVALSATALPETLDEIVDPERETDLLAHHILTYRLDGALFFGAAERFLRELTAVTDVRVVILRLPQLQVLDATGAQALGDIISHLEHRGITVLLKGPRPHHLRTMRAVGTLDQLAHERHLFGSLDAAIDHARAHVAKSVTAQAAGPA